MDKKLYKMMDWARVEQIVYAEDDRPSEYLGAHFVPGGLMINSFFPGCDKCVAIVKTGGVSKEYKMDKMDEEGFFSCLVRMITKPKYSYYFRVTKGRTVYEVTDPYSFEVSIPESVLNKFTDGICYDIYDYLGAHVCERNKVKGVNFAVWAPNALRVSVVGDFNEWDGRVHQMNKHPKSGVFELFIPNVCEGDIYKFELKLKGGMVILKSDPYGFYSELRPSDASRVFDISGFEWHDEEFISNRDSIQGNNKPISVYELYLGSFFKPEDSEYANYRVLADKIIPYVKEMGYTHIELMPVMEHPFDASWGYQVIGYYAPTSRYGTPADFMYFVDKMHEAGIGVILDWVPAHFPRDIQGLSNFDGTCLYEHANPLQGSHPDWGTLLFNYGRKEVSNYLIANALFWIKQYHADGIRIDAVASMLYLDYGRRGGEWIPNIYGGNENLEAVEFLKHLNSINKKMKTGAIMIAEESTAWPKVTGDLNDDGLGFDYKWNMGWMNDFLGFLRLDPLYRGEHYGELTFSMIYAYSEKFMLVFSHDEVVHGKSSMIGKMPGNREEKFANLRCAYANMFMHPGKKLSFMGQDIAEFDEWNETRSVQWDLLQYDDHINFNHFIKDMNALYTTTPAFYELDNSADGFEWINNISTIETITSFLRKDSNGNSFLVVCNFANVERTNYKIGVPFSGKYKEIFSTSNVKYGGSGAGNPRVKNCKRDECDGREYSIRIKVPPLSVSVFSCEEIPYEELVPTKAEKKADKKVDNKTNKKAATKKNSKSTDKKG